MPMRRRTLLIASNAFFAPTMPLMAASRAASPTTPWEQPSAVALAAAMRDGRLTSERLVRDCLARIAAIDKAGPKINSVLELNPEAIAIAQALDAERKAGRVRGPLHGLPVLVKDNIATGDRMSTSAGSLALDGVRAPRDAHVVKRLRDAGAVILGKTNLSEWANIRSTRSTSGWSARGGLTRNPYALDRNTSGSSSGTGAAIAAGLAPLGVGTETDGSIVSPSSICGLVGLKPTVGRMSRDGIIPIAHTQDTPGPMTRTVADAALLYAAMAGRDDADAATAAAPAAPLPSAAIDLPDDALRGTRLGVARSFFTGFDEVDGLIDQAIVVLKRLGAEIVDPVDLAQPSYNDAELRILLYELKADLPKYLATLRSGRQGEDARRRDRVQPHPARARDALVRPGAVRQGRGARRPRQQGVPRRARRVQEGRARRGHRPRPESEPPRRADRADRRPRMAHRSGQRRPLQARASRRRRRSRDIRI